MVNRLVKALKNPQKALRYFIVYLKQRFYTQKEVLIMIGVDPKGELDILSPGYNNCYVFEANPERYYKLLKFRT